MTTKKKLMALLMLAVMLAVMTVPALAALPEQLEPQGNYANEHCPQCGYSQRFYRQCYDGRQVVSVACSHEHGSCTIRKLYLGVYRICQYDTTHKMYTPGNHSAAYDHLGSVCQSMGCDAEYSCPYGAHVPVLGW